MSEPSKDERKRPGSVRELPGGVRIPEGAIIPMRSASGNFGVAKELLCETYKKNKNA